MKTFLQTTLICLCALSLAGCFESGNDSGLSSYSDTAQIQLSANTAPLPVNNSSAAFYSDIRYGSDPLQTFDLFLPQAASPGQTFPLVIYIHGGSFNSGDKNVVYSDVNDEGEPSYGQFERSQKYSEQINAYLSNDVAFATINYRLLEQESIDRDGVKKSLNDMQRTLQFIRFHAATLNIDKQRIGLHGLSAGAGGALWIGLRNEQADSSSQDPIAQESSRVQAIAAQETQSTYDLVDWISTGALSSYFPLSELFYRQIIDLIFVVQPNLKTQILSFFAMQDVTKLYSTAATSYRESVDFINEISSDDPELWVSNVEENNAFPTNQTLFFHHPLHAKELLDKVTKENANGVFYIPKLNVSDESNETLTAFMFRKLGVNE
ncbi:MAG: alpha/beta hydrolase [Pseudomonadota bacterium]